MATDPDGDSQMASSPESNRSLSDVEAGPGSRTPTQTTNAQFAGTTELSPPGSQSHPTGGMADITPGYSGFDGAATDTSQQPGASWMNKRAQEDYQRAMEYVVDLDFNLDEFGDPFDERDMNEKLS
ncbi:hypothetical protein BDV18DRAFT_134658 [Aspergillus unguis]